MLTQGSPKIKRQSRHFTQPKGKSTKKKFQKRNCVNQLLAAKSGQLHTMDSDLIEKGVAGN
jgi:hypothetical protein